MTFSTFDAALTWAMKHASDCCFAFQKWRVIRDDAGRFRVAVYSVNTGAFDGFAY